MFEGIINLVKGVFRKMFPVKTLKQAIKEEFALSDPMIQRIELWAKMNQGQAPWLDDYVSSLRIENGICREFANICLNEMDTSVSNEKLNEIYQYAIRSLNENLQSGLALGSFIIKPLGENKVEYVTADSFIPIEFDSRGRLNKVIFLEVKKKGESIFYRLEYHKLEKDGLLISNKAYISKSADSIGKEVSLDSIDEWATLPTEVFNGISIYDSSVELIKRADQQFGRLDWEFESGERAVHVDIAALQSQGTKHNMPKLNKRLYRGLNIDAGGKELYDDHTPELRDESIINGLNAYLRRIEFNSSLSYGDLSDINEVAKTATEMRIAKKRKYNMVTAIQDNLKDCLEDLVYALSFYNALSKTGYEFICNFKDSILVDEEADRQQDRQDVAMGVMPLWEYRMKWYGEDEEKAKSMLPEEADIDD